MNFESAAEYIIDIFSQKKKKENTLIALYKKQNKHLEALLFSEIPNE